MILVTLGTQDKSFVRLLEKIEELCVEGVIQEHIVIQAGHTKFKSKNMEVFDFIPMEEFKDYINKCNILITHGGVGSIIAGLDFGKKVIAVPRLKEYDEHENNHQLEIIEKFSQGGHILGCRSVNELKEKYMMLDHFSPIPYRSNNENFCLLVKKIIDNDC